MSSFVGTNPFDGLSNIQTFIFCQCFLVSKRCPQWLPAEMRLMLLVVKGSAVRC